MPSSIATYGTAVTGKGVTSLTLYRNQSLALQQHDQLIVCVASDAGCNSPTISLNSIESERHDYTAGDGTYNENIGSSDGYWRWAYTFTAGSAPIQLGGFALYIVTKHSSGYIYADIYNVDGNGHPTGSFLQSRSLACTGLTINAYNTFTFDPFIEIPPYETKAIVWRTAAGNSTQYRNETHDDIPTRTLLFSSNSGSTWSTQDWGGSTKEPYYILYSESYSTVNNFLAQRASAVNSGNVVSQIYSYKLPTRAANSNDGNISITFAAATPVGATAYLVREGTSGSGYYDKNATNTGTGTSATSGSTAETTQIYEVLVAAIGTEGPEEDATGTWGETVDQNLQKRGSTGSGAASNITVRSAAEIVNGTGTYGASISDMAGRDWAFALATFKLSTGISITPSAAAARVGVIAPTVTLPLILTGIAEAKAVFVGTFKNDLFVIPSAVLFKIGTIYPLYRRIAIGWARAELDISGVIRPAQSIAKVSVLNPTVVLSGNVVVDLAGSFAYVVAAIGQPFVPSLATYALRRWDGTQWIDEAIMVYQSGWVSKPLYMWLDNEWKEVG